MAALEEDVFRLFWTHLYLQVVTANVNPISLWAPVKWVYAASARYGVTAPGWHVGGVWPAAAHHLNNFHCIVWFCRCIFWCVIVWGLLMNALKFMWLLPKSACVYSHKKKLLCRKCLVCISWNFLSTIFSLGRHPAWYGSCIRAAVGSVTIVVRRSVINSKSAANLYINTEISLVFMSW